MYMGIWSHKLLHEEQTIRLNKGVVHSKKKKPAKNSHLKSTVGVFELCTMNYIPRIRYLPYLSTENGAFPP